jgi:ribosomal protein S18 acetylase RimI-like enzyme
MQTSITTYYLEMLDPRDLKPKRSWRSDVAMVCVDPPMPELNRFFYTSAGADWYWHDRLPWTYQKWHDYLNRPELETWMLTVKGVPAGYYELELQSNESHLPDGGERPGVGGPHVEIAYFGLLPQFVGVGLGGHLLTSAIERGFAMGAKRVWVHTCTLDHPQALANYKARGLHLYKEEVHSQDLPPQPSGPWPGGGPKRS